MNVYTTPEVKQYLNNLITILYEKDYFGCEENAHNYVDKLLDDVSSHLPIVLHKPAPRYFNKYGKGMFYATFSKNKQTTWYAFFSKYNENGNTIFLVRYVANNHTIAQYL
jgi:hypothetical protein